MREEKGKETEVCKQMDTWSLNITIIVTEVG